MLTVLKRKIYCREFETSEKHKKFPGYWHRYLFVETSEYRVKIHAWKSLSKIHYESFFPGLIMPFSPESEGSTIKIESKISGASLEEEFLIMNKFTIEWLLRSRNRNRDIWSLETELANDFCLKFDAAFGPLHEQRDSFHLYWDNSRYFGDNVHPEV